MYKIFVVFHKQIFDDCYKEIPQEILDKHFFFVAVNPSIPKIYTAGKYNIIKEWELPLISQLNNSVFRENTAIYNVYLNGLHKGCDYVGFAQYDMIFHAAFLHNINNLSPTTYLTTWNETIGFITPHTSEGKELIPALLQSYETYFECKVAITTLPLLNTYIIPVSLFNRIMPWVEHTHKTIVPQCYEKYESYRIDPLHYATLYERVMGIAIGAHNLQYANLGISHNPMYKSLAY